MWASPKQTWQDESCSIGVLWDIQAAVVKQEVQKARFILPFAFKPCLWLVFV